MKWSRFYDSVSFQERVASKYGGASQVIFGIDTHKCPLILSSAYSADLAELKGKRVFLQLSYSNMAENLGSQKVKALHNF